MAACEQGMSAVHVQGLQRFVTSVVCSIVSEEWLTLELVVPRIEIVDGHTGIQPAHQHQPAAAEEQRSFSDELLNACFSDGIQHCS
jgi:hypothetical protein